MALNELLLMYSLFSPISKIMPIFIAITGISEVVCTVTEYEPTMNTSTYKHRKFLLTVIDIRAELMNAGIVYQ